MAWVEAHNATTTKALEADRRYTVLYNEALTIAAAKDRIPDPSFLHGEIYNFWQDGDHLRGLWRKTSLADYRSDQPHWTTVLDIDALGKAEGKSWVFKGIDCLRPYNLATAHGSWLSSRVGARTVFFTWQNQVRHYPPPFSWFERSVFRRSSFAIAGNAEALRVLRTKGYAGPATVIPQFGVDPNLFTPGPPPDENAPVIGFISRLVEEKGIFVLLAALADLPGPWRLHVLGSGPQEGKARRRATELGLAERITWESGVPSTQIPERLRTFTMLVQPSLTRRNWKEQFGRAMMEAMACGVAVVGSTSAEIPTVIGDAGLIVPEGDAAALREAMARLLADRPAREELGRRGRLRVLDCYTNARIAAQTVGVYSAALGMAEASTGATIA
jgi:glycosyltransferase involved in cell wall biosynthesis